jgi:hypothetical protein
MSLCHLTWKSNLANVRSVHVLPILAEERLRGNTVYPLWTNAAEG